MKKIIRLFSVLFLGVIVFTFLDWSVDGFDFFAFQDNNHYFQSWISIAGIIFTLIMAIVVFFIYKKSHILSLKFISLSLLFISIAYSFIGYHTSYCKVCSDLSMCGASHNYSNYFIVIAVIILVVSVFLKNIKTNVNLLKLFAYGLIGATVALMIVLFLSIEFMETPDTIEYVLTTLNLQGFTFIFPLLFIVLIAQYFHTIYKLTKVTSAILILLFIGFIPQALHIFICKDCHIMECSEFFIFAGALMFIAVGLLIYALSLELEKKD